ncbi:MAG: DUF4396 domain-containing protein [Actinomycetota bacterium]|nr:DUF4396 domain-containing protein [Actinomycetota bacterium]
MSEMSEMGEMSSIPAWLTPVSWFFVAIAALSAAFIAYDIVVRGHRQRNTAMNVVWPATGLYLGPLAVWAWMRYGRLRSERWQTGHGPSPEKDLSTAALTGGTPGGFASLVGHIIGVPLIVLSGVTLAGLDLWAMIAAVAVIATAILFAYEFFFSTVPSRRLSGGRGVGVAALIAVATVLAFDIGMGGWMLFLHFGWVMPGVTDVEFLFLMQVGLILGFLTGYPMVRFLVARGVKAVA